MLVLTEAPDDDNETEMSLHSLCLEAVDTTITTLITSQLSLIFKSSLPHYPTS